MKITWSKRSILDIDNIFNYVKLDSYNNAKYFILEIKEKTSILSDFPELGKVSSVNRDCKNLREIVIHKNYIVTYLLKKEEIEIIHVWHVARNR
jgi:toxin ParE1/3/4